MKNREFEIGDNLMIVIIALIIMMALIFSCSSYEVVKKTGHPKGIIKN